MKRLLRIFLIPVCVLAAIALSGCAADKVALPMFTAAFEAGDYSGALATARRRAKPASAPQKALLWRLQAGAVERVVGHPAESNAIFDRCEDAFKFFDLENTVKSGGKTVGAVLVNDSIRPYSGEEYDRILVNTYKALNFSSLGDWDNARVEFNRALQRQVQAKERFAKEIQKTQGQLAGSDMAAGIGENVESKELKARIDSVYGNLNPFQAYPDFVNPFTTYMAGLFFLLRDDLPKAVDILKEAHGMVPENEVVMQDFASAVEGRMPKGNVWVVFENGGAPIRREMRVDLPLILVTQHVMYTGIALPVLELRAPAYPYLEVVSGTEAARTTIVADMDRVVQAEFKKDFPGILTRAISSALVKASAQYVAEEQFGFLGGFIVALYSAASTAADIRTWTALPKNFQVARVSIPAEGARLEVRPPGGASLEIDLPSCTNALVCVRVSRAGVPASVQVIVFP
ncbi:MAG: hypothetical protein KAI66_05555 [Lentisphaeria bacterium]|nr:hypothetical protein [Lentisphaeria bacterium]